MSSDPVVVMAYGTHDLLGGARPGEVLLAYAQSRQQTRAAGVSFFVATCGVLTKNRLLLTG